MTRRGGCGGQPSSEISEEEGTGSIGDHNEEKEDLSVLHILNDLSKGKNKTNETFSRGKRELIDTVTQLLSPLGNSQGLNTNGGNGQTKFHAEGSNSGAPDNGQSKP